MGDAGGEASQRGEASAPGDLLLEAPDLRHIPEEENVADEGAVLFGKRRCDDLDRDRPPRLHGAIERTFDGSPFRSERPEQLPAASRKDLFRRLPEDLRGGAFEDRLRRLVEGAEPPSGVGGNEADRHALDDAVGEGLDSGKGTPGRPVTLGEEQRDDPRASDQKKNDGHPDRVAPVLVVGGDDRPHVQADEDDETGWLRVHSGRPLRRGRTRRFGKG